jgi:hypothetical protein
VAGLANEQLNEGRNLVITTDYRRVVGEVAYKTLGARNLHRVFPGAQVDPGDFLTDPALNECHISGFHTSKFVWIQPMAGS